MITKDFYFAINIDPVQQAERTIYIPQIMFGDKLIWAAKDSYSNRAEATEVAESRLMQMMGVIFDYEDTSNNLRYASMLQPIG